MLQRIKMSLDETITLFAEISEKLQGGHKIKTPDSTFVGVKSGVHFAIR